MEPSVAGTSGIEVVVNRWEKGTLSRTTDRVSEEIPVALLYNGEPHVVMLATPQDLEDLGLGFSLSEGLVADLGEIRGVEARVDENSATVRIAIAWERFPQLLRQRRNLTGRTGCGLCGAETLEQVVGAAPLVGAGPRVTATQLHAAIDALAALQPLNASTGSVHAAAWVTPEQGIVLAREDIGRHNALDKCIGALKRAGLDVNSGFMLVTSRASYEMVHKSAVAGIAFLAALSAPTSLAVSHAERCGLTLVAFARHERHGVYAHGHRLTAH
jgi:formate dehydrogenase accessory protein FdhD